MVMTLLSATPSPYARKIRIQFLEKGIPFELKNEVPWDSTTETPKWNPLEKLPILIFDDGRDPIYESHLIVEYVEQKFEPKESMTPSNIDDKFLVKKLEVLADVVVDNMGLSFFEQQREQQSTEWTARLSRKIEGGVKALDGYAAKRTGDFIVGDKLTTADAAICSMLATLNLTGNPVPQKYPGLLAYAAKLEERESFKQTVPVMFDLKDKIM